MTVSANSASNNDPIVTGFHLLCVLGCSHNSLNVYLKDGRVPQPDARGYGNGKLWRLSTLHAWRPDIADAALDLVNRPPIRLSRSYLPKNEVVGRG